jgi:hypothetical protein
MPLWPRPDAGPTARPIFRQQGRRHDGGPGWPTPSAR